MIGLSLAAVQVLYFLAVVFGFLLAGILYRNRDKPGAMALTVGNFCVGLWSLMQFGKIVAVEGFGLTRLGVVTHWVLFPCVAVTSVAVFVFALEYTGRERYVTKRTLALLGVYPLAVFVVVVVNPDGVFYTDFVALVEGIGEDTSNLQGPAFQVHTVVSYALLLSAFAMILALILRPGRPLYRGQAVALLAAMITPFGFNILTITGAVGFDLTVVGFIASSSLFTVAIVRYELMNVTPIAREKVVENVRDGMVVVDTNGRVLDSNPAFRSLVDAESEVLTGTEATGLFEGVPDVLETYRELTAEPPGSDSSGTVREREVTYGDRHLNVQVNPIFDDRERHVAWLLLVHDITELVQRERDLEGQIEKLDQFAGIVSHDLRNPLNVANGYVQQAKVTGDLQHLDKTEEAMDRMETIISEALELARGGEDVTEPETVSLESVTAAAWEAVETADATLAVEDTRIRADESRLQRLLENLFRNSIEHGVDGDRHSTFDHTISVGFEDHGADELTVFIEDNGLGIPEEDIEQVFESGYTTNVDGTGLGLAIVDEIASAHGWTVSATESESGGARFELLNVPRPV